MSEPVSEALLQALGEWEGFEIAGASTEDVGDDVFGAPAPRLVLALQPKAVHAK